MQAIGKFLSYTANSLDITTCANDVIVVRHSDGSLHSSPFFVRFGRGHVLRPSDKIVQIEINGQLTEAVMKMGDDGTAFWLEPTQTAVDDQLESPVGSPNRSPRVEGTNGGEVPEDAAAFSLSPAPSGQPQQGSALTVTNTSTNKKMTSSASPLTPINNNHTTNVAASLRSDTSFATCMDPSESINQFVSNSLMEGADHNPSSYAAISSVGAVGGGSPTLLSDTSNNAAYHLDPALMERGGAGAEDVDAIFKDDVDPADKANFSELIQSLEASKVGTPLMAAMASSHGTNASNGGGRQRTGSNAPNSPLPLGAGLGPACGSLGGNASEGSNDALTGTPERSGPNFNNSNTNTNNNFAVTSLSKPPLAPTPSRGSVNLGGGLGSTPPLAANPTVKDFSKVGSVGDLVLSRFASVDTMPHFDPEQQHTSPIHTTPSAAAAHHRSRSGTASELTLGIGSSSSAAAGGGGRSRKASQMNSSGVMERHRAESNNSPMEQLKEALSDGVLPPKSATSLTSPPADTAAGNGEDEGGEISNNNTNRPSQLGPLISGGGEESGDNTNEDASSAALMDGMNAMAMVATHLMETDANGGVEPHTPTTPEIAATVDATTHGFNKPVATYDSDLDGEDEDEEFDEDELEYGSEEEDYGGNDNILDVVSSGVGGVPKGNALLSQQQGGGDASAMGGTLAAAEVIAKMNASGGADGSTSSIPSGVAVAAQQQAAAQLKPLFQRTLTPIEADLKRLNLKEGANIIRYRTHSSLRGTTYIEGRIFLWGPNTKIVVSDVDGTITKSDVLGHILPLVGKDWTHTGICDLYTKCAQNGYQFLYLTARSVSYMAGTRRFLWSIVQDNKRLPLGPVLTAPDRFFAALTTEVSKRSHEFKIACLEGVRRAFPQHARPFYAGFGNRINDVVAYSATGIPKHKIFIIDHDGVVHVCKVQQTYNNLSHLVHETFPPLKGSACVRQFPHRYATNNYPGAEQALPAGAIAGVLCGTEIGKKTHPSSTAASDGSSSSALSSTATAAAASSSAANNSGDAPNNASAAASGPTSARGDGIANQFDATSGADAIIMVAAAEGVAVGGGSDAGASPPSAGSGSVSPSTSAVNKNSATGSPSLGASYNDVNGTTAGVTNGSLGGAPSARSDDAEGASTKSNADDAIEVCVLEHYEDPHQEEQDFNSYNFWRVDPRDYLAPPKASATGTAQTATGGGAATDKKAEKKVEKKGSGLNSTSASSSSNAKNSASSSSKVPEHILVAPSQAGKDGINASKWASTVGSVKEVPPVAPSPQTKGKESGGGGGGLRSWLPWGRGKTATANNSAPPTEASVSPSTASSSSVKGDLSPAITPTTAAAVSPSSAAAASGQSPATAVDAKSPSTLSNGSSNNAVTVATPLKL